MQYKNEKTLQLIQEFGKTLKEKRETLSKKSQTLFAYEYELDSGNISRIENGKIDPKLTMLWRISEALGIPLSQLIKSLEDNLGKDFHISEQ
ncbi:MAG: helix-turn-helix transcriptional regulator [Brachyspira sp.]|nr:helix-turn-helix transcriptional regulator [Brachyspira sp.]